MVLPIVAANFHQNQAMMSHDDLGMVLGSFPFFPEIWDAPKNIEGLRQGAYTMRPNKIMAQIKDFLTGRWRWVRRIGDGSTPANQLVSG